MRVVIADDEPLGQRGTRARLAAAPDIEVVAECATGAETVSAIERLSPDLVFLGIQMPDMDGFDVLRRLPAQRLPLVIFVTAHGHYALRAFDAHTVDYRLKPIDDARLASTLERACLLSGSSRLLDVEQRSCGGLEPLRVEPRGNYRTRMTPRSGHRISIVPVSDIEWVGATGDYVTLHVGKKQHLVRQTIGSLERELDPDMFIRVHRSTIVQTSQISELVTLQNGEALLRLRDGTELRASRSYSRRLEEWLSS